MVAPRTPFKEYFEKGEILDTLAQQLEGSKNSYDWIHSNEAR